MSCLCQCFVASSYRELRTINFANSTILFRSPHVSSLSTDSRYLQFLRGCPEHQDLHTPQESSEPDLDPSQGSDHDPRHRRGGLKWHQHRVRVVFLLMSRQDFIWKIINALIQWYMYHYFVILLNKYYIILTDLSMIFDYIKEQVFEVMSAL